MIQIGRYANVMLDRWFKRTFGTEKNKRLLELLLAELIPERKIKRLEFAPQEHVNTFPDGKDIRVDVECTDEDGSRFVVEMQVAPQDAFYDRALFNSSFAIQQQMGYGSQWSSLLPPVYFIGIMAFSFHPGSDRVLYRYRLREDADGSVMTEAIQYIFLELPNCSKALTPEASVLDNFSYALYNLSQFSEPPGELDGEMFRLLFDSAEIATFTPQERKLYQKDMRTERDIINQIAYAKKQGREEGARANALDTARKMLADKVPVGSVAKYTGLAEAELLEIAKR